MSLEYIIMFRLWCALKKFTTVLAMCVNTNC